MPAAMEKKYLSYSVRALRPNGGLDPLPRQMRKEALQASISGFSLNDPVCPEPPPPGTGKPCAVHASAPSSLSHVRPR